MQQIVILGGGAAGLAAALAAAQSAPAGAVRVTVLDRNPRCGKKLLATGNGRCNLDNTGIAPELYFTADPAALRPLLDAVNTADPLRWGPCWPRWMPPHRWNGSRRWACTPAPMRPDGCTPTPTRPQTCWPCWKATLPGWAWRCVLAALCRP